jgi:hypothetical protein
MIAVSIISFFKPQFVFELIWLPQPCIWGD